MLDTVTLVYTQVLVDLTRFQTLDGLSFSYLHPRIVSGQFAVDKLRDSTLVQTKLHPDVIRKGTYRVQQPIKLIRISAICVVMPLHEWATGSLPPAGRPTTRQVGPSEVHVSV